MRFESQGMGDFIIIRSDGMAAYNFACVIDDHLMHVSHVIRGEDHLSNTPRQILIYQTLGWQPPVFAHHPLILGADRSPLSKRHGATAVSQYREEGFLPDALVNYLVLLGWTPPSGEEILSFERVIEYFSLGTISKSAPVFDRKKLEWLNSHSIRNKADVPLSESLLPYIEKTGVPIRQSNRTFSLKSLVFERKFGEPSQMRNIWASSSTKGFSLMTEPKPFFGFQKPGNLLSILNVLEALPETLLMMAQHCYLNWKRRPVGRAKGFTPPSGGGHRKNQRP